MPSTYWKPFLSNLNLRIIGQNSITSPLLARLQLGKLNTEPSSLHPRGKQRRGI